MLWTIFVVVLVLWLLGFSFHIAGGLIHLLLVVALIILIFNLISGRRSRFVKRPEPRECWSTPAPKSVFKPEDSILPREVIPFAQFSGGRRSNLSPEECAGAQPRWFAMR